MQQNATKPNENPVLLSSDIQEKTDKLNREIMYLVNKIRNYKPPKPKSKTNSTKKTTDNKNKTTPIDTKKPQDEIPPEGIPPEGIPPNMGSDDDEKAIDDNPKDQEPSLGQCCHSN